jgi:hypothetical protein
MVVLDQDAHTGRIIVPELNLEVEKAIRQFSCKGTDG